MYNMYPMNADSGLGIFFFIQVLKQYALREILNSQNGVHLHMVFTFAVNRLLGMRLTRRTVYCVIRSVRIYASCASQ